MASLTVTHSLPLLRLRSDWPIFAAPSFIRISKLKSQSSWSLRAVSRKKLAKSESGDVTNVEGSAEEEVVKTTKRAPKQSKKKTMLETPVSASVVDDLREESTAADDSKGSKKTPRRTRKKATVPPIALEVGNTEKKTTRRKIKKKIDDVEDTESEVEMSDNESLASSEKKATRRKTKKKIDDMEDPGSDVEMSDDESLTSREKKGTRRKSKKKLDYLEDPGIEVELSDNESLTTTEKIIKRTTKKKIGDMEDQGSDIELSDDESLTSTENIDEEDDDLEFLQGGEDISFTYGWPPLVCCFGAAQHAFIPSGRPANRLIDHTIQERMKDAFWAPQKFVRAPGSSSSSVAVALASLGGRVALMGKLGDDDFGRTMLYYLNVSNVQTRSIIVDGKRPTAISQMKIGRRGGLRLTCVKPCAEDSLSRSEINIDVLKEAKMFYFNSSSLLEQETRLTTLRAIKISRKLGALIFFDLNLPLPLWRSSEETKNFIQQAWNMSDIVEVTKQELEFLSGIVPAENFDTKDNDRSKFIHHKPEVVMPLWHENLKVLFVTNGTSKIHYYTEKYNGAILGMEAAPVTPFTCDMSSSGDGIVAGIMRMLSVQPHLITDKGYLEKTIKYAIECGVIDQWKLARERGFPPKEDMEEELVPDPNGIMSISETEYRTLQPAS